jgi:hypothetical protein
MMQPAETKKLIQIRFTHTPGHATLFQLGRVRAGSAAQRPLWVLFQAPHFLFSGASVIQETNRD